MRQFYNIFLIIFILLYTSLIADAQIGINVLQPDTSAILHLESTNRGFLPPRLSKIQRDNIFSPKPGLIIFNTTDSLLQYFNGECWISTWQKNCKDCVFEFKIDNNIGHIDRIQNNSDSTRLFIRQVAGDTTPIAVYVVPNLPQGMSASLSSYLVNNSDTVSLTVNADIFTAPGVYPVIVQAICGNSISNQVFVVTVDTCFEVEINNALSDYNLQAANNLPTSTPICAVARIKPGVVLDNILSNAVFNTGTLHPDSKVGIWNEGDIIAKGGDGGAGAGVAGAGNGDGLPGTDAINLTVHTHIVNNGRIFGGGGGGGSVGLVEPIVLGIGTYTLGIGAGGGGGAQSGLGGNLGTGFGFYDPGRAASNGVFAQAGNGGTLTTPINFNLFAANFTLTPTVLGGKGGEFGMDGQAGTLLVNVLVQIVVPVVGTVTLLNQDFPNPPPASFPPGGQAGFVIKRNGNTMIGNLNDGYFQSSNLKGRIGN